MTTRWERLMGIQNKVHLSGELCGDGQFRTLCGLRLSPMMNATADKQRVTCGRCTWRMK